MVSCTGVMGQVSVGLTSRQRYKSEAFKLGLLKNKIPLKPIKTESMQRPR